MCLPLHEVIQCVWVNLFIILTISARTFIVLRTTYILTCFWSKISGISFTPTTDTAIKMSTCLKTKTNHRQVK
jgi:hypothetical protein